MDINVGDKVHYTAPLCVKENGIVKQVSGNMAFVVFHCDSDWDNYTEYTGQATYLKDLTPGWITETK